MTIAVIGAGASGMMAALTAAETPENKILLFERQARVGRKLAVKQVAVRHIGVDVLPTVGPVFL